RGDTMCIHLHGALRVSTVPVIPSRRMSARRRRADVRRNEGPLLCTTRPSIRVALLRRAPLLGVTQCAYLSMGRSASPPFPSSRVDGCQHAGGVLTSVVTRDRSSGRTAPRYASRSFVARRYSG